MGGRTDERTNRQTNGQTDEQKSPCVLQNFVPFGEAAQKGRFERFRDYEGTHEVKSLKTAPLTMRIKKRRTFKWLILLMNLKIS